MENPEHTSLVMIITHLIQAYLKRLGDIAHLASLEARLAVKTLVSLAFLFFIVFILLLSSWFSALVLLFIYLVSLHYSFVFSAAIITLMNVALLLLCGVYIWKIKRNLFFPATRKHINSTEIVDKDVEHEQPETAN